jgi:hypothetical protein
VPSVNSTASSAFAPTSIGTSPRPAASRPTGAPSITTPSMFGHVSV